MTRIAPPGGLWCMEPVRFNELLGTLERIDAATIAARLPTKPKANGRPYSTVDGVAVIPVNGVLTKSPNWLLSWLTGNTSATELRDAVNMAANDLDVSTILLVIDSPGGEVAGTGDAADAIYSARKRKRVVSIVEDLGASAAYWLASQASEVYSNTSALIGSIGTYVTVQDWSKAFDNLGVAVHVIKAGEFKGTGVTGTALTETQRDDLQRIVNDTNGVFLRAVTRGRGLAGPRLDAVSDGRVFIASEALKLGLIDGIATVDELVVQFAVRKSAAPTNIIEGAVHARPRLDFPGSGFSYGRIPPVSHCGTVTAEPVRSAKEQWEAAVRGKVDAGVDYYAAVREVDRERPGLRQQYLSEVNTPHGRKVARV